VSEIAAQRDRHLILLTATPHSGFERAFRSLLSLLRPEFGDWNMATLTERERIELARHFVQRTRRDIEKDWEGARCFPRREGSDETYRLSRSYRALFEKTHDFCSEIVRSGQSLGKRQQRVRYWGALALLRCVMSSPAAAVAALESRHDGLAGGGDEEPDFRSFVFESADEQTDDESPTPPVECAGATLADADRRRLRELGRLAKTLLRSADDTKLAGVAKLVEKLLASGFHPIVWCRYIATAEYLAERLQDRLRNWPKSVSWWARFSPRGQPLSPHCVNGSALGPQSWRRATSACAKQWRSRCGNLRSRRSFHRTYSASCCCNR
jgi:hypothetical protein